MNAPVDPLSLLQSQHARLITLACPQQQGLVVEQFTGREGVNELFLFDVDALSTSANLDIDALVGAPLSIALLQPDGARRAWHGICTHAGMRGADGGVARYRLRLEPALAQLRLRRDSYLFQGQDVRGIIGELLRDYPDVQCEFDLSRSLTPRAICTQYRETDFAFFTRLLASEGLNYRFEHAQSGHRVVIFDSQLPVPALPGGDSLRFHGVRAADDDDAIDQWHARRTIVANGIALSSWDPQQLVAPSAQQQSNLDAGELPAMQVYDGSGECIATGAGTPGGAAVGHGRLMMLALEQRNKVFEGAGAVRRLAAGYGFTLTRHANYPLRANRFTVLWVTHAARNNFETSIKGTSVGDGTYRNRFACVRDTVAVVPDAVAAPSPDTVFGTQTALVVGLPDSVATTTRDHQVKIQFGWQRGGSPNPGGLEHPSGGNAPGDASSGAWVRVAEALAGPNWGSQFVPRVGTEVLVAFAGGDIDRPFIVGQLHNAVAPPMYHAGALSGIHTDNFSGGYNQWQLDDTQNQLRMRLASSSAFTELHLGQLVQQSVGSSLRGVARGSGFELRTDAWTVLRGAAGVLLTTNARGATGPSVTSTQMDAQEAVAVAHGAKTLSDALTQAAAQQKALASKEAAEAQADFIEQVDPQANGKYNKPVGGQAVSKARMGSRDLDTSQPVERFGTAAVLLDAAASLNWATPASMVVSADQQLHWTMHSDCHVAAGATIATAAGASASMFTHSGGIQAYAGNGPVSLQAHTDQLEIIADKEVIAVSVTESIAIAAKTKIVLQAGQSSITLEGGDITFACPGNFTAKGGQHVFDAGARAAAALTPLPEGALPLDTLYLDHRYHDDQPLAGAEYLVQFADGTERQGTLDADGRAEIKDVPPGLAQVRYGPMPGMFQRIDKTPTPNHDPAPSDASIDGLIDKYLNVTINQEQAS